MNPASLRSLLLTAGLPITLWQLPDSSYETVSEKFVRANWQAWLDARPAELCEYRSAGGKRLRYRPRWLAEAGDCDNLALGTLAHAQVGNALSMFNGNPRGGLAYGMLFYVAGPARPENHLISGGHAINWFVDPARNVRFFEPGMGTVVDLNPAERSSAWFGLAC